MLICVDIVFNGGYVYVKFDCCLFGVECYWL